MNACKIYYASYPSAGQNRKAGDSDSNAVSELLPKHSKLIRALENFSPDVFCWEVLHDVEVYDNGVLHAVICGKLCDVYLENANNSTEGKKAMHEIIKNLGPNQHFPSTAFDAVYDAVASLCETLQDIAAPVTTIESMKTSGTANR